MISIIGAAIALLSGLVALISWYVKRKKAPTLEERKEDVRQQFQDSFDNVYRLRQQGNHAEAEAMLRRLYDAAAVKLPDPKQPAQPIGDADGKRLGDNDPEGKPNPPTN